MRRRSGQVSGAAAVLLLLAAPAALAQQGPGIPSITPGIVTDDAQACISVANLTEYNWPISIRREGRARSTVGVKPREVMRYCAPDRLKPGEHIIVTLRSSRSEEHTSELQSLMRNSYAVFCLKKKKKKKTNKEDNNK